MDEEFVPYEPSLDLKELGFNEPCFGVYGYTPLGHKRKDTKFSSLQDISQHEGYRINPKDVRNSNIGDDVSTPLYQQAFRWFREKYGLYYTIGDVYGDFTKWSFTIGKKDKGIVSAFRENDVYFNTYEETEFECLKKLIEIVKENKPHV